MPPDADILIEPLLPLLQLGSDEPLNEASKMGGSVTVVVVLVIATYSHRLL